MDEGIGATRVSGAEEKSGGKPPHSKPDTFWRLLYSFA
jgi:hypothetical protein